MEIFPYYLKKIKEFDLLHNFHLNSSGALFSSVKIGSSKSKKPIKNHENSIFLTKIREKDQGFLQIFQTLISNFELIDSQYLKIYKKFLSSIFRNGSYQNCIKELIRMFNELVEEYNRFLNEYELLIRIKTYQDLELFSDDDLTYYENKLDVYLRNIRDVKLQRNSKYLKLVKKNDFHKKPYIFNNEGPNENANYLLKNTISLNEILEEFDKIYAGDDQLDESMIENIIMQKIENESQEIKKIFFNNVNLNYPEILEKEFHEFEEILTKLIKNNESKNQGIENISMKIERKIRETEENNDFLIRKAKNHQSNSDISKRNIDNRSFSLKSFANSHNISNLQPKNNESSTYDMMKNTQKSENIKKNLFNDYFQKEKKLDFPLQMTIKPEKSKSFYSEFDKNSSSSWVFKEKTQNLDDLSYSKSFYKGDFPLKKQENDSFQNVSFQNSLNNDSNSKENMDLNQNNIENHPKQRRKRCERLKFKENC